MKQLCLAFISDEDLIAKFWRIEGDEIMPWDSLPREAKERWLKVFRQREAGIDLNLDTAQ